MFLVFLVMCNFYATSLLSSSAAAPTHCPPWVQAHKKMRASFQNKMYQFLWVVDPNTQEPARLKLPLIPEIPLSLIDLTLHSEYVDKLKHAIDRGADLTKTIAGQTPLYTAVCSGNTLGALLLLDAGVPVDHQTLQGHTPLICATAIKNIEIMKKLIFNNASVRLADANGRTPLHMAALYDYTEGAYLLIAAGATVNAQDHKGNTPLHLIARASCVSDDSDDDEDSGGWAAFNPLIILLVARGADQNLKNTKGESAADLVDQSYKSIWDNSLNLGENQKKIYESKLQERYYMIEQSIATPQTPCGAPGSIPLPYVALINAYAELPT